MTPSSNKPRTLVWKVPSSDSFFSPSFQFFVLLFLLPVSKINDTKNYSFSYTIPEPTLVSHWIRKRQNKYDNYNTLHLKQISAYTAQRNKIYAISSNEDSGSMNLSESFDSIADSRYACTRFLRHTINTTDINSKSSNVSNGAKVGTESNPWVLKRATEALHIALRAPSGFNSQPYKAIIVSDPEIKTKMSHYCLGRNADRVRDSDCTVVFLADCQCTKEFSKFKSLLQKTKHSTASTTTTTTTAAATTKTTKTTMIESKQRNKKPLTNFMIRKIQIFIALFSSGYPYIPHFFSNIFSFFVRTTLGAVGILTRHKILLPSLATSETWASKNTMLFAMTYMLSCSSKNIVTCPMEGFQARGIKRVLKIPSSSRFKIPLIVSTGLPYHNSDKNKRVSDNLLDEEPDDAGMSHGRDRTIPDRYDFHEVVYGNTFAS